MAAVSVVVPTRNRPAGLRANLQALAALEFRDFEVVVVDDSSTVTPRDIVRDAGRTLDLTLLVNDRRRGPSAARNRGVARATGRFIAFVDDDVRVVPNWINEHLRAQGDASGRVATIGPLAAPLDWRPQAWTWWEADTLQRQYRQMVEGVFHATWRQFHTGNAFLERSAIIDAGGFNESLLRAEDIELAARMARQGLRFEYVPEAIGWHYSARSREAWLAAARSYGQFDRQFDRAYADMNWMRLVQHELSRRHPLLRAFRRVAGVRGVRSFAVLGATAAGSLAHAAGLRRLARGALSAAYDLEYTQGLAEGGAPLTPATSGP